MPCRVQGSRTKDTHEMSGAALDYPTLRPLGSANPHMWLYSRGALNIQLTLGVPPESTGNATAASKEPDRRTCLDPCNEIGG